MAAAIVSSQQVALLIGNPCKEEENLLSVVSSLSRDEEGRDVRMRLQHRSFDDLTSALSLQRKYPDVQVQRRPATQMVRPRSSPPGKQSSLSGINGDDDDAIADVAIDGHTQYEDSADSDATQPAQRLRLTITTTKKTEERTENAKVSETAAWSSLKRGAMAGIIPASSLMLAHGRSGAFTQRVLAKLLTADFDNETRHHVRESYASIERVRRRNAAMRVSPLRKHARRE